VQFKTMARFPSVLATALSVMLLASATAQAGIGVPRLMSPSNRATVKALPAFTWSPVRGAASYQFEFSATRSFASGVADIAAGPISLATTGFTNAQSIPDGSYYWRVRAVSTANVPGRWSRARRLTKRWQIAPKLLAPAGSTINWPSDPLLLRWRSVRYAVNYQLEIGTTPALTTLVYGPVNVQGPEYSVPMVLSPGTYYWAVRPIDAAGQFGARSAVRSFTWSWNSTMILNESDASPDADYQEPSLSWTPVPGASSYEVEVATDPSYPANAIILDTTGVTSTYYTSTRFFPNHTTLYWRVRAIDSHGDAGVWNQGESFTELFDQRTPQNFHVVRADGSVDDGDTSDQNPILRWSPVAGASYYRLTFVPWSGGVCNFNADPHQIVTADTPTTAWTPGAQHSTGWESSQYGWTGTADNATDAWLSAGPWCVSLIAVRSDAPLQGSTIESAPTVLGGASPAFTYVLPTASGPLTHGTVVTGAEIVPPAYGSGPLSAGSTISTAPLFEWNRVPNADGYYVIIANDEQFDSNSIVAGGFTNTTSWAPPGSLQDQTAAYWWEVLPVNSGTAGGEPLDSATNGSYQPQAFNKNSVPPSPRGPIGGANAAGEPTFSWSSAQGAVSYTLQISADPTFANPIETDNTDLTTVTTGPALSGRATLYWRVRANDIGFSLNWSPVQTFTHNLPVPQLQARNPRRGSTIPFLAWAPVSGATSYNVVLTTGGAGGPSSTVSVPTPDITPAELFAPGVTTYQVQSVFPGGGVSAYSTGSYHRTIPPPSGIRARKRGSRILITWKPDPIAKAYVVQLSTSSEFSSPIVSTTTATTAWIPQLTPQQAATRLHWRLAVVDYNGAVGSYHTGVFR
jgi:hypothetical protein